MISVAAVIAVVILACAWDVVQAKMESETYNRLTGANTTWVIFEYRGATPITDASFQAAFPLQYVAQTKYVRFYIQ